MKNSTHQVRMEGGLYTQGDYAEQSPEKDRPTVSIITVVFNNESHLEETVESVRNQTYENIEYIIIDGGSTDGTLEIIRKYNDKIAYWLSEPDNGIYDAMNKGAALATGEWINFMNAGDTFYRPHTVEKVFSAQVENADFIYGNNEILYNDVLSVIRRARDIKGIWKGIIVNHQSLFVKTGIMRKHPFNAAYKIGADYEFIYSAYIDKCKFHKTETVISSTAYGGLSDMNIIPNIKEQWMIAKRHNPSLKVNAYYLWLISYAVMKNIIKKILPAEIRELIIKWKYN